MSNEIRGGSSPAINNIKPGGPTGGANQIAQLGLGALKAIGQEVGSTPNTASTNALDAAADFASIT